MFVIGDAPEEEFFPYLIQHGIIDARHIFECAVCDTLIALEEPCDRECEIVESTLCFYSARCR
jgi:hypothetical protein